MKGLIKENLENKIAQKIREIVYSYEEEVPEIKFNTSFLSDFKWKVEEFRLDKNSNGNRVLTLSVEVSSTARIEGTHQINWFTKESQTTIFTRILNTVRYYGVNKVHLCVTYDCFPTNEVQLLTLEY